MIEQAHIGLIHEMGMKYEKAFGLRILTNVSFDADVTKSFLRA